jgi:hypothetical protein
LWNITVIVPQMKSWTKFLVSGYLTLFTLFPLDGKQNTTTCSGQEFSSTGGANATAESTIVIGFDADDADVRASTNSDGNEKKLTHIHNEVPSLPPIYIINLDRATQRWAKAVRTMEAAGLTTDQFTRLSAIDGRALSIEELRNQSTKLAIFLQPRGVIGCYLSHRRFWQLVVDQKLPRAIVLEDDIVVVEGFRDKLRTNLQAADAEQAKEQVDGGAYDVLFLGAIGEHATVLQRSSSCVSGVCRVENPHFPSRQFPATTGHHSTLADAAVNFLLLCFVLRTYWSYLGRVHPHGRDDFGKS